MLDQSFSPENFKIISHIENRKGNIDKTTHLTEEYIKCVLQEKSQKELLKEKRRIIKLWL